MEAIKIFLIFCAIFTTGNTNDIPNISLKINSNAVIRQLFEMMKYYIRNGHVEKKLPILDPFEFQYESIEILLPNRLLSLRGGFQNGTLKGLANFQIEEVEFIRRDVAVDLLIVFPFINFLSGYYKVKGDIYNAIPLEGEGKFDVEFHKLLFKGRVYLKASSNQKSILIHNVTSPQIHIKQIFSRTNYDRNIDDIINSMINDLLARYINRFNCYISQKYSSDFLKLLNDFLNKLDSWHILTAIL